jgi:hypothetical protein
MAIYTRKTFIAVADLLNDYVNLIDQVVFEDLVADFGDMFFADNPNFNYEKFREACEKNG